jgi:hypothetical protein
LPDEETVVKMASFWIKETLGTEYKYCIGKKNGEDHLCD